MGCTRSIDFEEGLPAPTSYWKMASIVSGATPDSVGSNDLVLGKVEFATFTFTPGGSEAVVPGGLITSAMSFPSSSFPSFLDVAKSTNPLNISNADSFTFRIWVKDAGGFVSGLAQKFVTNPGDLNAHSGGGHVVIAEDIFYMHRASPYDEQSLDFSADDTGAAVWHRVIISFDPATNTMLSKFDNDASRTFVNPTGSSVSILDLLVLFLGGGFTTQMCECGLWKGIVLTEPQMLLDWNGGAGVTFP